MINDFETWSKQIGSNLTKIRNSKGLLPTQAAEQSCIERRHFNQIERGEGSGIRLHEAINLSEIYGVSIHEICNLQDNDDKDLSVAVNALKSFSPELRHHYRIVLRSIQVRLEEENDSRGIELSVDPFKLKKIV